VRSTVLNLVEAGALEEIPSAGRARVYQLAQEWRAALEVKAPEPTGTLAAGQHLLVVPAEGIDELAQALNDDGVDGVSWAMRLGDSTFGMLIAFAEHEASLLDRLYSRLRRQGCNSVRLSVPGAALMNPTQLRQHLGTIATGHSGPALALPAGSD
jgi:hypothetical protein